MDKVEYRELIRSIKNKYLQSDYEGVIEASNQLELSKIRENSILEIIAKAYESLGRYDLAKDALLIAYKRTPTGKRIAYNLTILSIKLDDLDSAVMFYEDFCQMAPKDNQKLLLKYEIGRAGGIPIKDLIKVLEVYNEREMDDKWEYELARLYHEAGDGEKCAQACDQIILWYANGEYEKKALELKNMHKALTPSQQARYEEIMEEVLADTTGVRSGRREAEPVSQTAAADTDEETRETETAAETEPAEKVPAEEPGVEEPAGEGPEAKEPGAEEPQEESAAEAEPQSDFLEEDEEGADEDHIAGQLSLSAMLEAFQNQSHEEKEQSDKAGEDRAAQILAEVNDAHDSSALEQFEEEPDEDEHLEEVIEPEVPLLNREDQTVPVDDGGTDIGEREAEFAFEKEKRKRTASPKDQEEAAHQLEQSVDATQFIPVNQIAARIAREKEDSQEKMSVPTAVVDDNSVYEEIDPGSAAGRVAIGSAAEPADEDRNFNMDELIGLMKEEEKTEPEEEAAEPENEEQEEKPSEFKLDLIFGNNKVPVIRKKEQKAVQNQEEEISEEKDEEPAAEEPEEELPRKASPVFSEVNEAEEETETAIDVQEQEALEDLVEFDEYEEETDEEEEPVQKSSWKDALSSAGSKLRLSLFGHKKKEQAEETEAFESDEFEDVQEESPEDDIIPEEETEAVTKKEKRTGFFKSLFGKPSHREEVEEEEEEDYPEYEDDFEEVVEEEEVTEEPEPETAEEAVEEVAAEAVEEPEIVEETIEEAAEEPAEEEPEPETVEEAVEEVAAEAVEESEIVEEAIEETAEEAVEEVAAEAVEEPEIVEETVEEVTEEAAEEEPEPEITEAAAEEAAVEEELEIVSEVIEIEEPAEEEPEPEQSISKATVFEEDEERFEPFVMPEDFIEDPELYIHTGESEENEEQEFGSGRRTFLRGNKGKKTKAVPEIFEPEHEEDVPAAEEPDALELARQEKARMKEEKKAAKQALKAQKQAIRAQKIREKAERLAREQEEKAQREAQEREERAKREAQEQEERAKREAQEQEEKAKREAQEREEQKRQEAQRRAAIERREARKREARERREQQEREARERLEAQAKQQQMRKAPASEPGLDIDSLLAGVITEGAVKTAAVNKMSEESLDDLLNSTIKAGPEPVMKKPAAAQKELKVTDTGEFDLDDFIRQDTKKKETRQMSFDDLFGGEFRPKVHIPDAVQTSKAVKKLETGKKYKLSQEQRKTLGEFLLIEGMEEEIEGAIENLIIKKKSGDETGGHMIVTGDTKSGKTFLTVEILKAVNQEIGHGNPRVAKVQAQAINGKNIKKVLMRVADSDLIIENIGRLEDDTVRELITAVRENNASTMVILEGNELAAENMILKFPDIAKVFKTRVNIGELTLTQWSDLAQRYAKGQGYYIDSEALLALHAKIDEISTSDMRLGLSEVKKLVDDAIEKAEKQKTGKLFSAFSKKTETNLIPLTEENFI